MTMLTAENKPPWTEQVDLPGVSPQGGTSCSNQARDHSSKTWDVCGPAENSSLSDGHCPIIQDPTDPVKPYWKSESVSCSVISDSVTPWAIARQAPLSRQGTLEW